MSKKETGYDLNVLKKLLGQTKAYRGIFVFVLLAAILTSAFAVARPYFLQYAIDKGIFEKNAEVLINYTTLMIIVLLLEVFSQVFFTYYANWLGQHVIKDMRVQLFERVLGFRMQYFDNSAVGRLVTRTVSDIQKIAEIFSQGLFTIVSDVLKMTAIVVFMLYKSWQLTVLVFSVLPIIIYATRLFHKKMKTAFEQVRSEVANLNTFVQEHISGMKIVQIFAREEAEFKKFKAINERHKNAWVKTVWYNSIFFPVAELCSSIAIGLLVWYGGVKTLESNVITIGLIVTFIQLSYMLFRPLRQIADKFNTLQMGIVAAKRVFGVLETNDALSENVTNQLTNVNGVIEFKDVRFSYIPDEEVLKGISFTVEQGQTMAIVGATGAGKSTIVNLLNRFYDINAGQIFIDDVDIHSLSLKNLREHIAIVLQDVFLFADSIYQNITLGNPEITKEHVIAAAKEIGVHDFIMELPGDYDYNVKERGSMLSSGQRQLISFLRAYVTKPNILVLDEATSSVDSYSEQLIQNATEKITADRTSIVIAHRLATIKKADVILVMEQGKIVEKGTHASLLKNQNGYYRKLYDVQFAELDKKVG